MIICWVECYVKIKYPWGAVPEVKSGGGVYNRSEMGELL